MIALLNAFCLGANVAIALYAYLDEVPPRNLLTWVAIGVGGASVLSGLLW
jgi:hypothetical protein